MLKWKGGWGDGWTEGGKKGRKGERERARAAKSEQNIIICKHAPQKVQRHHHRKQPNCLLH